MDVTDRGVSSVLDAALFALFVGGAIVTLTLPAAPAPDEDRADAVADTLATTTADVEYTLAPGARRAEAVAFPWTAGQAFERTAHGTLAEYLATAAVGAVAIDGQQVTHTYDDLASRAAAETRNATRNRHQRVSVRAIWEPYPDAPLRGTVSAGPTPPPAADVHAATLTVDSGLPATRSSALAAAGNGSYDAVAAAVANGVVRGLFPPNATRHALLADYPVNRLVDHRYRRYGSLLGTDTASSVSVADNERNVTGANEQLRAALAERLAVDMRERFETPRAAARAVRVGDVRVTVRTWSP